jgi:ribonuclease HII
MQPDLWKFEHLAKANGFSTISGIDEAGRGPLAGPVVSAAVIVSENFPVQGVIDSKQLTPKKRDVLYDKIYDHAVSIGIGIVDAAEIDRINIHQASLLSMIFSVQNLDPRPDMLLIDGPHRVSLALEQQPIIKGDSKSISIAAASIIAKVTRDRLMEQYHQEFPHFGFNKHKGYPTKAHKEAIAAFGSCHIHRKTFKGVKEFI